MLSLSDKKGGVTVTDIRRKTKYRNDVEYLCEVVEKLPIEKKILFRLYFRYGYTTIEIAKFMGKHDATISRRIKKIAKEVEGMLLNDGRCAADCPH